MSYILTIECNAENMADIRQSVSNVPIRKVLDLPGLNQPVTITWRPTRYPERYRTQTRFFKDIVIKQHTDELREELAQRFNLSNLKMEVTKDLVLYEEALI